MYLNDGRWRCEAQQSRSLNVREVCSFYDVEFDPRVASAVDSVSSQ